MRGSSLIFFSTIKRKKCCRVSNFSLIKIVSGNDILDNKMAKTNNFFTVVKNLCIYFLFELVNIVKIWKFINVFFVVSTLMLKEWDIWLTTNLTPNRVLPTHILSRGCQRHGTCVRTRVPLSLWGKERGFERKHKCSTTYAWHTLNQGGQIKCWSKMIRSNLFVFLENENQAK